MEMYSLDGIKKFFTAINSIGLIITFLNAVICVNKASESITIAKKAATLQPPIFENEINIAANLIIQILLFVFLILFFSVNCVVLTNLNKNTKKILKTAFLKFSCTLSFVFFSILLSIVIREADYLVVKVLSIVIILILMFLFSASIFLAVVELKEDSIKQKPKNF